MGISFLEPVPPLSSCRKNIFASITLCAVILLTYSNTFDASWHFDDAPNILHRESLHLDSLKWQDVKQTFFVVLDGNLKIYRPAACLSFALNYYFGQADVFGYHVVNLTVHLFASIFLFLFVSQAFHLPWAGARYRPDSYSIALFATFLWAINPVQTQAVTYIVQRMASLAAMFYIMSMYFYLKGRTSEKTALRITHYFFCALTAILAFSSKENAVLLPVSLFLLDLFLIQGLEPKNIRRKVTLLLALLVVPVGLVLILRSPSDFSVTNLMASYSQREYTLCERLLTQPRILFLYLSMLFYPMPGRLSILHDVPISQGFFDPPSTLLALVFLALLLGITIVKSRQWPWPCYCLLFFFVNHLIESSLLPLELVFEHRNYLPSMLLFVPVSILVFEGLRFFSSRKFMRTLVFASLVLLLVALGHSTFIRNFAWKTEESLWLSAIDHSPNLARPYHNLGKYYGSIGDREKEMAHYFKALQLGKDSHGETRHLTHYNLALAYNAKGQEERAIGHLRKALEFEPGFSNAHNNLGALLVRRREYNAAFDHFIQALTHDGKHSEAHCNLGIVLLKQRRFKEAAIEFRKALATKKDLVPAFQNLGVIYKYEKDFPKAKSYFQKALEKDKKNIMTRLHLAETLFLMDNKALLDPFLAETLSLIPPERVRAVVHAIRADRLPDQETPDLGVILPLLGKAYLQQSESLRACGQHFQRQKALR